MDGEAVSLAETELCGDTELKIDAVEVTVVDDESAKEGERSGVSVELNDALAEFDKETQPDDVADNTSEELALIVALSAGLDENKRDDDVAAVAVGDETSDRDDTNESVGITVVDANPVELVVRDSNELPVANVVEDALNVADTLAV